MLSSILNALPSSVLRFLAFSLEGLRFARDLRLAIWAVLYSRAEREVAKRREQSRAERLAELDALARTVPEFHGWSCAVGEA